MDTTCDLSDLSDLINVTTIVCKIGNTYHIDLLPVICMMYPNPYTYLAKPSSIEFSELIFFDRGCHLAAILM